MCAAYQKFSQHLLALLGDAFLTRISISRVVSSRHKPQVCSHGSAFLEAVGILQGEHEGECCKWSDSLDLAQELGFWVTFFGDLLQLSVVLADALGERADLLEDGT